MSFSRRFRPLPLSQVQINGKFWSGLQRTIVDKSLPNQWAQLESTRRLNNFRAAAGETSGQFKGLWFNDSDVYKWVEAAAYALAIFPSAPDLRGHVEEAISLIGAAQEASGYINTFFQLKHPTLKWRNLGTMHEMYCGGHLIEAGVALFESTGDRRLLDIGRRFADHLASIFGPGLRRGFCGHPEIEWALIRLSDATGDQSYRELARWMVDERGQTPPRLLAPVVLVAELARRPLNGRGAVRRPRARSRHRAGMALRP